MTKYIAIIGLLLLASCKDQNRFTLDLSDSFSKDDFTILLETPSVDTIYANGTVYPIPDKYGENDWIILYKDSLSGKFRHFKTNRNDRHSYLFQIFRAKDSVLCLVNIEGVSELKRKVAMLPLGAGPD
jgi:hypothetical protein